MNIEISVTERPASRANTAPMAKNEPCAAPVPRLPITPSGEIR